MFLFYKLNVWIDNSHSSIVLKEVSKAYMNPCIDIHILPSGLGHAFTIILMEKQITLSTNHHQKNVIEIKQSTFINIEHAICRYKRGERWCYAFNFQ